MLIQKMKWIVMNEILFVLLLAWVMMPSPVLSQDMPDIEAEILAEMGDSINAAGLEKGDEASSPAPPEMGYSEAAMMLQDEGASEEKGGAGSNGRA